MVNLKDLFRTQFGSSVFYVEIYKKVHTIWYSDGQIHFRLLQFLPSMDAMIIQICPEPRSIYNYLIHDIAIYKITN